MYPQKVQKRTRLPPPKWNERNIQTAEELRQALWSVVEKYTGNPLLVQFAAGLIKKRNVPARDDLALARAVQKFSQDHIKFFREDPERFTSPLLTIKWGLGDCDDKSTLIASILRSFRVPCRLKFIKFSIASFDGSAKTISHVYPMAKINNAWVALESVHPWQPGDDPEKRALAKGIKPEVHFIGDN